MSSAKERKKESTSIEFMHLYIKIIIQHFYLSLDK